MMPTPVEEYLRYPPSQAVEKITAPSAWVNWLLANGWPVTNERARSLDLGHGWGYNARRTLERIGFVVDVHKNGEGVVTFTARPRDVGAGDTWALHLDEPPEPLHIRKGTGGRRKRKTMTTSQRLLDRVRERHDDDEPTTRKRPHTYPHPTLREELTVTSLSAQADGVVEMNLTTREASVTYVTTVKRVVVK